MGLKKALLCLALTFFSSIISAKDTFYIGVEAEQNTQVQPVNGHYYHPVVEAVLQAFAVKEDIRIKFVSLPNDRFSQWFNENTIDFRFPDHPRWSAADQTLFYSQPVVNICEVVRFMPQNSWMRMPDVKRLGTLENVPLHSDWKKQERKGFTQVLTYNSEKALIDAVVSGKIDAVLGAKEQIESGLRSLGEPEDTLAPSEYLTDKKSSLRISSTQYPAMLEKLDMFINSHQGLITQVARRHNIDNARTCGRRTVKNQSELAD
ncbi:transporter substrate-binding domain-containing protein [Aestuariibacter sp. A3R04]|uniref:transporter substrate-binding domain-containing protein n=1 Tax=Aestuariibacter sp. A3R04 TaxID=2841571 RepID=UPI001C088F9B|nr:transporter substrate-binding domain-containing protein [Aestuariibacter sp. A3R04]MBU3022520.1 transporter substrate-binding domain-containing protein [Aestuariibacter sp. A3R04]